MGLEACQLVIGSPSAVHFGFFGHVLVSSESPSLVSAYTKVSLGRAPRPKWSEQVSALQEAHRSLARILESRIDIAFG